MIEQTLSIIKPDAMANGHSLSIKKVLLDNDLEIVEMKTLTLTMAQAHQFYEEHLDRPFFGELTEFMTSGPVTVMVLEGENAISRYRELMGSTDPEEAAEGTLRKLFAESKGKNAVHGSDSQVSATREIQLLFGD